MHTPAAAEEKKTKNKPPNWKPCHSRKKKPQKDNKYLLSFFFRRIFSEGFVILLWLFLSLSSRESTSGFM
jgi:hypothetical protein